jgi:hypothetical protein
MGQRAIRSWISRHSYHSAEQTVKNKKLDHRVQGRHVRHTNFGTWGLANSIWALTVQVEEA